MAYISIIIKLIEFQMNVNTPRASTAGSDFYVSGLSEREPSPLTDLETDTEVRIVRDIQ